MTDITNAPQRQHWNGRSPTTSMTHIAVQEALDGKNVIWMEPVTDEQYRAGPAPEVHQAHGH